MLKEFLLSAIISSSLSIKSSNDETKPHDYDVMIKLEKNEDNISYLIKKGWERELGNKYEDNIFRFNYVTDNSIYYGFDLVDNESKQIDYKTFNLGYKYDFGLQSGLSFKRQEKTTYLAHISYSKKFKKDLSEYVISVSAKSDMQDDNIYDIKTEYKIWLSDRVNMFLLYKHIYFNKDEDYQFKIGFGYKLLN